MTSRINTYEIRNFGREADPDWVEHLLELKAQALSDLEQYSYSVENIDQIEMLSEKLGKLDSALKKLRNIVPSDVQDAMLLEILEDYDRMYTHRRIYLGDGRTRLVPHPVRRNHN